ncbi:hypothetical protein MKEN_01050200 [Mycena kentingensis (nom. inval.)]|nr:hypothetical protein MKEN_01050200 [Mycena kentingensis (nom. inval.)]
MPPPAIPSPEPQASKSLKAKLKSGVSAPLRTYFTDPSHHVSDGLTSIERGLREIAQTGAHWPPLDRKDALNEHSRRSPECERLVDGCTKAVAGGIFNSQLKMGARRFKGDAELWLDSVEVSSSAAREKTLLGPATSPVRAGSKGTLTEQLERMKSVEAEAFIQSGYYDDPGIQPMVTPFTHHLQPPTAATVSTVAQRRFHIVGSPPSSQAGTSDDSPTAEAAGPQLQLAAEQRVRNPEYPAGISAAILGGSFGDQTRAEGYECVPPRSSARFQVDTSDSTMPLIRSSTRVNVTRTALDLGPCILEHSRVGQSDTEMSIPTISRRPRPAQPDAARFSTAVAVSGSSPSNSIHTTETGPSSSHSESLDMVELYAVQSALLADYNSQVPQWTKEVPAQGRAGPSRQRNDRTGIEYNETSTTAARVFVRGGSVDSFTTSSTNRCVCPDPDHRQIGRTTWKCFQFGCGYTWEEPPASGAATGGDSSLKYVH